MAGTFVPALGRQPWVMGVVNVTPDSFSDGGLWLHTDAAIAHGKQLASEGADIIDIGGESTRPGAHRIDVATEKGRVIPVIEALSAAGITCSIDTSRAEVAAAAIEAGVAIVNDVSGGLADPDMVRVVADAHVPWILMHWRGPSDVMNSLAQYTDVAREVREELLARVDVALAAGIDERRLILDPGLGFAKTAEHNWQVLQQLDELVAIGLPVMIGASRKRFLGELLAGSDGEFRTADGRENATAAVSLVAAQHGAWGVRVHDVRPTLDAFAVLRRMGPGATSVPAVPTPAVPSAAAATPAVSSAAVPSAAVPSAAVPTPAVTTPAPAGGDHVTLTGLTIRGHHGVFDFEKRDGQDFVVDITVAFDIAAAARADDVATTINYAELADLAAGIVSGPSRDLIETVATEIAEAIVARWPVRSAEVTVHKPHAPIELAFADVAVTVVRQGTAT